LYIRSRVARRAVTCSRCWCWSACSAPPVAVDRALAEAAGGCARDAADHLSQENISEIADLARDLEDMRRDILAKKRRPRQRNAASQIPRHEHEIARHERRDRHGSSLLLHTRLDERQRHFAQTIKGSGATLLGSSDILDVSRSIGHAALELRTLDLASWPAPSSTPGRAGTGQEPEVDLRIADDVTGVPRRRNASAPVY